jgi:hypothetical protein
MKEASYHVIKQPVQKLDKLAFRAKCKVHSSNVDVLLHQRATQLLFECYQGKDPDVLWHLKTYFI